MEPIRDQHAAANMGTHTATVEVAGADLVFRPVAMSDRTPTGAQIAFAAGFKPNQHATVLHLLDSGEMEDMRPTEVAKLSQGVNRFIVAESDRSYRLTVDGQRFDWPCVVITGAQLRKIGAVGEAKVLYLERKGQADQEVNAMDYITLDGEEVEAFYSTARKWELKVQDIKLTFAQPEVLVRDAVTQAGFDVDQEWHIFLKVVGQPKQPVTLATVIDLRTKGIEKLRLTPKDINNGEAVASRGRREFSLLDVDEAFLDQHYGAWEAILDGANHWLLIYNYPVPAGYEHSAITLALQIPGNYPAAQIDMFFVTKPLTLTSGAAIPNTEHRENIQGKTYQRWSRHRNGATQWKSATDNVITHLALVEDCLAREVGQ